MTNSDRLTDPTELPSRRLVSVKDYVGKYGRAHILNVPPADVALGFPYLDHLLNGGLRKEQVMIIGARTSVGKSAFVGQLALNVARSGKRVGIFSLEMSYQQLLWRMVCFIAGVSFSSYMSGVLTPDEEAKCNAAIDELETLPLMVDDKTDLSPKTVKAILRSATPPLDLMVLDYLQLMASSDNRSLEVANISRSLHNAAREFQLPIIALCQLNRKAEEQEVPSLSTLRESGAIEQDADIIGLLFRPSEGEEDDSQSFRQVDMVLPKNRNGKLARVQFHFYGDNMRFVEAERDGVTVGKPEAEAF